MHKTPLPEIPSEYGRENTVELYWEVRESVWGNHELALVNSYIEEIEAHEKITTENNPKSRWWNLLPRSIKVSELVPAQEITKFDIINYEELSYYFDEKEIYTKAVNILKTLEKSSKRSMLVGKYPPKTLDIDPVTLSK